MTMRLVGIAMLATVLTAQVSGPVAAHVSRGVAAREAGRLEEARRELEAAVRAAPEIAEAHLYLGLVLHESGDFAAAADSLGRALDLKPGLPGARELLGYDLLMLGRAAEAISHLDAARHEDPANWRLSAWLGRALLDTGDAAAALPHLLEAQAAATADPELLYLVAKAYSQLSLQAQAQLLTGAPESSYAHLATAEDHDFNGRAAEAIAAYHQALAGNEALPDAWRALGDLERDRGRHRDAVDAYRRALEIQTGNGALHLRCGESLLALGLADQALPHLETAARADPVSPVALGALGKALLDLERFDEAQRALSQALAEARDEQKKMEIHYQLARASRKLGDAEAAQAHLREFRTLRAKLTATDK